MKLSREKSQPIFDRAMNVMVKGVSSNFRFLGKNSTPVIAKGKGAHIWDADGNKFIDYRLGWGPIILGHADDRVSKEVSKYLENGTSFAATTELEVIVAEKIVAMVPGMERLRFTNTGTEATMHALRTARGYTNKEKFIKFEGQYHGVHDYVMFSTASSPISAMGSKTSPIPVQVGSGIPNKIREYVYCLPFNDFVIGNGIPVAAFGGKSEVMNVIGGGSVAHAGTFGGNGVSMSAANAVLDILNETPVLKNLSIRGKRLKEGMDKILNEANLPHQMCGHPNIQGFLITENKVQEVRDLAHSDDAMYEKIMDHMFDRGVWAESDPREPWFLCASHTEEIIDETLNIFQDSVQAAIK